MDAGKLMGVAPRSYANAAGGTQQQYRICDMGIRMGQVPGREILLNFFEKVGINKEQIEGVIKFPNGQIDLTFRERKMVLEADRNMIQMKRQGINLPSHWLYISENVAVYLSWVPIRMDDKRIEKYFENNHGPIKSIFQQRDEMGYKNGVRSILVAKKHIEENPIKSYIWIDGARIAVKYKGQTATCAFCEQTGHYARLCPQRTQKRARPNVEREARDENLEGMRTADSGIQKYSNPLISQVTPTEVLGKRQEKETIPKTTNRNGQISDDAEKEAAGSRSKEKSTEEEKTTNNSAKTIERKQETLGIINERVERSPTSSPEKAMRQGTADQEGDGKQGREQNNEAEEENKEDIKRSVEDVTPQFRPASEVIKSMADAFTNSESTDSSLFNDGQLPDWFDKPDEHHETTASRDTQQDGSLKRIRESSGSEGYAPTLNRHNTYAGEEREALPCEQCGKPIYFTSGTKVCTCLACNTAHHLMRACCNPVDQLIITEEQIQNASSVICGICKSECTIAECCGSLTRKDDRKVFNTCNRCNRSKRYKKRE